MGNPNIRKQYPTVAQKARLVAILVADEELRKGKYSSTFARRIAQDRWRNIAKELNSIAGPNKTSAEWRKTWQDMKSKSKKKLAAIRRAQNVTGLELPPPPLSNNEAVILKTLSNPSIVEPAKSGVSAGPIKDVQKKEELFSTEVSAAASLEFVLCGDMEDVPGPSVKHEPVEENMVLPEGHFPKNHNNSNREKCNKPSKPKKSVAQMYMNQSILTAAALVETLKQKIEMKKEYYENKLIEMKRQSEALMKIANSLSHDTA